MYIFAIIFLSTFAFLEVFNPEIIKKYKAIAIFACFVFFIIHDGLRWETGSDWIVYKEAFDNFYISSYDIKETFEPLYFVFMGGIRLLSDDYSVYLVIHALLFYSIFFYTIFKISTHPFVSLLVFYMIIVPFLGMNRQFLAMAIFSIALIYIQKEEWKKALLIILLATFFHRTAFLAIPIVFLRYKIKSWYIIIAYLICGIIAFSGLINIVGSGVALYLGSDSASGDKLSTYVNLDAEFNFISTILSFARKLFWIILLFVFDKKVDKGEHPERYTLLLNTYIISTMIYLLFNGTILQIIVSRGQLYYNLAEMFIIPYALSIFKNNIGKLAVMVVLSLYCTINIYKGFSNYGEGNDFFVPYKGVFINRDYERQDI